MGTKKCPYCAEDISVEAIKCKHCGEFLEKRESEAVAQPIVIKSEKSGAGKFLMFLAILALIIFILRSC